MLLLIGIGAGQHGTRTLTSVDIDARQTAPEPPARRRKGVSPWLPAKFAQAATASGCTVTIAKQGGNPVPAGSILSIMGLGIKQGDTVEVTVDGDNAETVIDSLIETLTAAE